MTKAVMDLGITIRGKLLRFEPVILIIWILIFYVGSGLRAQNPQNYRSDSLTVNDCIRYAMENQPLVKQLKIDEGIVDQNIHIALSDWLPQINTTAGVQRYLKQPVSMFPDFSNPSGPKVPITTGVLNNSNILFTATENLFNSDVYIAGRTAKSYRLQSTQTTRSAMIELVVEINKAFYEVLLSHEQLEMINEEIGRLSQSLKDAYSQYQNGAADIIDYKRATIALNNALAQKKSSEESINVKTSYLKQLMGYPAEKPLTLNADIRSMEKDVMVDTLETLNLYNRIEYQLLQTNLRLQKANIEYYRFGFLPSLSAFANYNISYQSDAVSELYKRNYPYAIVGLTLSLPVFQGTKRMQNIRKSKMEYEKLALDTLSTRNEMATQYVSAMASYKSNLASYKLTRQNNKIAEDVYNMVKLQYNQGIKNYLEVIISETDLMSARINNINALFMLMFSKIDVERALGKISVDY
jgi:outer membrane protein